MKVTAPLLERACKRFPIDSEQIVGMRYITDDFIEFDIYRKGSLCYWYDESYEMLAPSEDLDAMANGRYFSAPEYFWDGRESKPVADHLSSMMHDRCGYEAESDRSDIRSADGFAYNYRSPTGMHRMIVTVASDRDWIVEIVPSVEPNSRRLRDAMLDEFYRYAHRWDLPMGLL